MSNALSRVLRHNLKKAFARGKLDEVGDLLQRLKVEAPLNRETRGFELEYLIETNHFEEADALAEQLRHAFPDSSRIHFLSGKLAYLRKKYGEAVNHFRESNRLFNHWRSQYWQGKALTQLGKLDEALPLLEETVRIHAPARLDLAWLYFRKDDLERALEAYERVLVDQPNSKLAQKNIALVKARMLAPGDLVEEIESLQEFGEETPIHLLAEYVNKLFETGRGDRAREEVRKRMGDLDARVGVDLGWKCYHAGAFDLAFELWLPHFGRNRMSFKFLNALEKATRKCRFEERLVEVYEEYASREPQFYGRIKSLIPAKPPKEDI